MNRDEYINTLERSLVGKVDPDSLRETISYYRDYFAMEQSKGLSEEEIIRTLGDPRLLAKSMIAAEDSKKSVRDSQVGIDADDDMDNTHVRTFHIPFALLILIIFFLFLGVVSVVFSIASALLPLFLPVLVVFGIISFFKKR